MWVMLSYNKDFGFRISDFGCLTQNLKLKTHDSFKDNALGSLNVTCQINIYIKNVNKGLKINILTLRVIKLPILMTRSVKMFIINVILSDSS